MKKNNEDKESEDRATMKKNNEDKESEDRAKSRLRWSSPEIRRIPTLNTDEEAGIGADGGMVYNNAS